MPDKTDETNVRVYARDVVRHEPHTRLLIERQNFLGDWVVEGYPVNDIPEALNCLRQWYGSEAARQQHPRKMRLVKETRQVIEVCGE